MRELPSVNKADRIMHHIIPVMHLKHFVGNDPKGQVWTYPKQGGKVRSAIPEETATERHFYSVERPDGTFDNSIETMLSEIEGAAEAPYSKLLRNEIPRGAEREDFAAFAAIMYVRTRSARRMSAETHSRMYQLQTYATALHDGAFETLMRRIEAGEGRTIDDRQRELIRSAMKDPSNFKLAIPKQTTLDILGAANEIMALLHQMSWSVLTPRNGFFITSDNPLRRVVTGNPKLMMGDGGFYHKHVEVTLPLSPHRLLGMSWNKGLPSAFQVSREYVDSRNALRVQGAEREVYTHIRHRGTEKLLREYSSHKLDVGGGHFPDQKLMETVVPRRWEWRK